MVSQGSGADPFAVVRQRIDRAKAHYETYASEANAFLERDVHSVVHHVEPDGHGYIVLVVREDIPDNLRFPIGEMLYSLRAAFDNFVYAAAIVDSRQDPPPGASGLEFPICESPQKFAGNAHKIQPLTQEHKDWIEEVQPYHANDGHRFHPLWWLHELARTDRHRAPHIIGGYVPLAKSVEVEPLSPDGRVESVSIYPGGPLENGQVVGGFVIDPPTTEVRVNLRLHRQLDIDMAVEIDGQIRTVAQRFEPVERILRNLIDRFES